MHLQRTKRTVSESRTSARLCVFGAVRIGRSMTLAWLQIIIITVIIKLTKRTAKGRLTRRLLVQFIILRGWKASKDCMRARVPRRSAHLIDTLGPN